MPASGIIPESYGSEYGDDSGVDMSNVNPLNAHVSVQASTGIGSGISPGWYMWGVPVAAIVGLFILAIWFKKG